MYETRILKNAPLCWWKVWNPSKLLGEQTTAMTEISLLRYGMAKVGLLADFWDLWLRLPLCLHHGSGVTLAAGSPASIRGNFIPFKPQSTWFGDLIALVVGLILPIYKRHNAGMQLSPSGCGARDSF